MIPEAHVGYVRTKEDDLWTCFIEYKNSVDQCYLVFGTKKGNLPLGTTLNLPTFFLHVAILKKLAVF